MDLREAYGTDTAAFNERTPAPPVPHHNPDPNPPPPFDMEALLNSYIDGETPPPTNDIPIGDPPTPVQVWAHSIVMETMPPQYSTVIQYASGAVRSKTSSTYELYELRDILGPVLRAAVVRDYNEMQNMLHHH